MALSDFRDELRDPTLRLAWKLGWACGRIPGLFDEKDISAQAQFRKVPFNNAFIYSLNKKPKRDVLIYLLAMPALEDMEPGDIVAKFGETVGALTAELKTIDNDEDAKKASRLARETIKATFGFFDRNMKRLSDNIHATSEHIDRTLTKMEENNAAHTLRMAEIEAKGERDMKYMRVLGGFTPVPGAKPN